jgi:hypothetical protein
VVKKEEYLFFTCFSPREGRRATVPPVSPVWFPLGFSKFSRMTSETSGRKENIKKNRIRNNSSSLSSLVSHWFLKVFQDDLRDLWRKRKHSKKLNYNSLMPVSPAWFPISFSKFSRMTSETSCKKENNKKIELEIFEKVETKDSYSCSVS